MSEEQKLSEGPSFPVRYMPVSGSLTYKVLDTLTETRMVVCETWNLSDAHRIAKLLNESEGYVYEP